MIRPFIPFIATAAISIVLSILINLFIYTTEAEVWKKSAYQNIYRVGVLEKQTVDIQKEVQVLVNDLAGIRYINQVDSVLKKHGL